MSNDSLRDARNFPVGHSRCKPDTNTPVKGNDLAMITDDLMELEPLPRLPPPAERKRLRTRMNVNQATVAKWLGINTRTFYRWETGKDISSGRDTQSSHPAFRKYAELLKSWQEKERLSQ